RGPKRTSWARSGLQHPVQREPAIRIAATTPETYLLVGQIGAPLFVAVRTVALSDLKRHLYQASWTASGPAGRGDVGMSVTLYVAETALQARAAGVASTMSFFRSISKATTTSRGATTQTTEARAS